MRAAMFYLLYKSFFWGDFFRLVYCEAFIVSAGSFFGAGRKAERALCCTLSLSLSQRKTAALSTRKLACFFFFFPSGRFCLWWTAVWFWLRLRCRMQFMGQNAARGWRRGAVSGRSPPPPTLWIARSPHDGDPSEPVVRASGEKTRSLTSELAFYIIPVFSFN